MYKKAVTIRVHPPSVVEAEGYRRSGTLDGNFSESRHFVTKTRQSYMYPREIREHRGAPGRCGKACHQVQDDDEDNYEAEEYIEVITVREEIMFNQSVCEANRLSS